ncbi:MAG: carbohydrate binding domain-containing protein, partial [bacterium]
TPVRFVGVNLVAGAAFPDSAMAKTVARRLAKFGVNLVRLHHLDNFSLDSRETLITPGSDTRHLNPEQFARLDYFIHQLALHGIYISITLNSARRFQPGDGVARADSLPLHAKAVSLFESRLIFLQQEHAGNLLSHQNPHTGLRYAEDPRIAMLEISNENSLYAAWKQDLLNGRRVYDSGLSHFHQQMLDSLWHDFLRNKYGDSNSLRQAWLEGVSGRESENLLRNGDFESSLGTEWILEQHGNASATLDRTNGAASGSYAARVRLQNETASLWDVQLKQVGMPMTQDSSYTLSFWARSELPRQIRVALVRDDLPSINFGLDRAVILPSGLWQAYTMNFSANQTNLENARLTFALSGAAGEILFDNVQLQHIHVRGLLSTESLEARNVKRIEHRERLNYSAARVHDTAEFYESRQREAYAETYRFIKEKAGARMLITASNIYGGPADAKTFAEADYIDHHAYWDHPQYPT